MTNMEMLFAMVALLGAIGLNAGVYLRQGAQGEQIKALLKRLDRLPCVRDSEFRGLISGNITLPEENRGCTYDFSNDGFFSKE